MFRPLDLKVGIRILHLKQKFHGIKINCQNIHTPGVISLRFYCIVLDRAMEIKENYINFRIFLLLVPFSSFTSFF